VIDLPQVLSISRTAIAFTAVCEVCLGIDTAVGLQASTFAGRLDPDLEEGIFLCRRGHHVRVVRVDAPAAEAGVAAA
jgi:hypothetical protein